MRTFVQRVVWGLRPGAGGRALGPPLLCAVLAGLSLLPACMSPRARKSQLAVEPRLVQSETRFRKEYVLAPGDQIDVLVRRASEVSRTVNIRPDGYISLPLLDDVRAAGLSPAELKAKLTQLFSARLVDPEVTVIANQVRQPMVYVAGDVGNPGAVPLRSAATAMQAIGFTGGLRRSAAARDIAIIRLTEDGYVRAIPLVVEVGGQPGPYMTLRSTALQADDIIFVPENGRSQLARFLDDIVNKPLLTINSILGVYVNFKFIDVLSR